MTEVVLEATHLRRSPEFRHARELAAEGEPALGIETLYSCIAVRK